jgi:glycine/D-amino acid oxidase-like deaminating enzyme
VVILGAGLTGSATAYMCAMAGLKPIVIEGERVGQGSSGRSAGLLLVDPGPPFRDIVQAHGVRAARRVVEAWARGTSEGAALLKRLKVAGGVVPMSDLTVAFRGEDKALAREHSARDAADVASRWLTDKQAKAAANADAAAAIRVPYGFAVNPYAACVAIATAASRRGATFYERSPARKVKFGRKSAEVQTGDAIVRASSVIVTTGIATMEFKQLRRHFKRRETYMVMTQPVPAAVRRQLCPPDATLRDMRAPHHRLRWVADHRLVVSGADQEETPARTRDAVLVQRTGQLMYELLKMYPAISGLQPEYGWHLPYGETADGLMYIGPHRNYPHHLFALGGGGDSISGAFVAARVLARAARGQSEKADEVFGWTR